MAEHKEVKKDAPAAAPVASPGPDLKAVTKFAIGFIFFVIVGSATVLIVFLNPETARNFVTFLNGIEILLGIYLGYSIFQLRGYMHKFDHHVEHLGEFFKHRYKPPAEKVEVTSPLQMRFDKAKQHIYSKYKEEWKIGVIELDTLLKDLLARKYKGDTVGELLKDADSKGMLNISVAWDAHKVRNQIVHEGIKYDMSNDMAMQTLRKYTTVFNELGLN